MAEDKKAGGKVPRAAKEKKNVVVPAWRMSPHFNNTIINHHRSCRQCDLLVAAGMMASRVRASPRPMRRRWPPKTPPQGGRTRYAHFGSRSFRPVGPRVGVRALQASASSSLDPRCEPIPHNGCRRPSAAAFKARERWRENEFIFAATRPKRIEFGRTTNPSNYGMVRHARDTRGKHVSEKLAGTDQARQTQDRTGHDVGRTATITAEPLERASADLGNSLRRVLLSRCRRRRDCDLDRGVLHEILLDPGCARKTSPTSCST